jgi:hypothetical protein
MGGTCSKHRREAHKVLVENPGGIRPLGIPTQIWENDTEMDLEK